MTALPADLAGLRTGGKAALARCLSALETAPQDPGLLALLDAAHGRPCGLVLGLTGPPGVGKSTLINAFVGRLRARGTTVGVIAVDPSSRQSGGALLGDRTRIASDPEDAGVFVRSMAARRRLGGVADLTYPATVLMRALFDWVIVETVGVGQSETEISDCADLVVLCAQPGSGDALQYMKAGVIEVPDIVLVTKGDMGGPATRAAADVAGALSLAADRAPVEIAIVAATTGVGIDAALDLIARRSEREADAAARAARRASQSRAWAQARLLESFGRVGYAALAPRLADLDGPFSGLERLCATAGRQVHKSLKNI